MTVPRKMMRIWLPIIALVSALVLTLWPVPTTFDITAQTESLRLFTTYDHVSRWHLVNVKIYDGFGAEYESFSGSVQIEPDVEVSFDRIAFGPFRIRCKSNDPQAIVAKLFDVSDKPFKTVRQRLVILFEDLPVRLTRGESVVMTFEGRIEIGGDIRLDPGPRSPLLRKGKISVLGHSLLDRQTLFTGGVITLDTGDLVTIDGANACTGLVLVNEDPALTVAVRAVGKSAKVTRFASKGYNVTTSLVARIKGDGPVQAAWAVALFLAGLIGYMRKSSKGDRK